MKLTRSVGTWLGRLAIAGWIALGVFVATLAPENEPMSPEMAERLFGELRSAESAAPAGALAFAEMLRRLNFGVNLHYTPRAPDADVLVLLAPTITLEDAEVDDLVGWIERGGRLIYAPAVAESDSEEAGADASEKAPPPPHLLDVIQARADSGTRESLGAATLMQLGHGRIAVLGAGGDALSNASLADRGIDAQLSWLRRVLDGVETVAFDEGRIGMGAEVGLLAVLGRSRFAPGLQLALLALLLLVIARGVRRMPPLAETPAGGRSFAEYLDALAALLHTGGRLALARTSLLDGTRRRLGGLARTDYAATILAHSEQHLAQQPSAMEITRDVEALRRLEQDLLGGP